MAERKTSGSLDGEEKVADLYIRRILGGGEDKHPAFMPPDEGVSVTIGNPSLGLPSLTELGYDAKRVGDMSAVLGEDGVPTIGGKIPGKPDLLPQEASPMLLSEDEINQALERPERENDPNAWMRGQGLHLMEMRYYKEAKAYYMRIRTKHPDLPDGWLGLAATALGLGKTQEAVENLIKGCSGPKSDVAQAGHVVARGLPEEPEAWINIANLCASKGTEEALLCAQEILKATIREAKKYTGTPVHDDAEQALAKLEKFIDLRRRNPAAFQPRLRTLPIILLVGALLGLVVGGLAWFSYQFIRSEDASAQFRKGLVEYAEGNRLAAIPGASKVAAGSLGDPSQSWARAFHDFQQALKLNPKYAEAHYMVITTGKRLLSRANGNPDAISVPLDEVTEQVAAASEAVQQLDPSGEAQKNLQAELSHAK